MDKPTVYDVLVVYTDGVATSASTSSKVDSHPFSLTSKFAEYNDCYAYLFKVSSDNNIDIAFTTSGDMTPDGNFKSHWVLRKNKWIKKNELCSAPLIFDKFSPVNKRQSNYHKVLFSNINIKTFNSLGIISLFSDKQETYNRLSKFAIPTVTLKNDSLSSIKKAVTELEKLVKDHPGKDDFSNKIVIKDRYGAGGNFIFKTKNKKRKKFIRETVGKHKEVSFVLQPFTDFETGYMNEDRSGFVDVRIIFIGSKIIQCYLRTAAENDFRCNQHQGGSVEYINSLDIPVKIKKMADEIIGVLKDEDSLFALDFILSNQGNVYLMEGNSHPGVIWSMLDENDEKNTKELIHEIVGEFQRRIVTLPSLDFSSRIKLNSGINPTMTV